MTYRLATAFVLLMASPLSAQTVLSGDHSVSGNLCVGGACTNSETFQFDNLKLNDINNNIWADDATEDLSYPANDWRLRFNDTYAGGGNYFSVHDETNQRTIFRVDAGARSNALRVTSDSYIGLGTSLPRSHLHIVGQGDAALLLQAPTAPNGNREFELVVSNYGLNFFNNESDTGPFDISHEAPEGALRLSGSEAVINSGSRDYNFRVRSDNTTSLLFTDASTNHVGIGTDAPETGLHVKSGAGNGALLIEETSPGTLGQLTLRNNGITYFTLEDTSIADVDYSGRKWNFQNQNGTFRVTTPPGGAGEIEMLLEPVNGDMTIRGELFTGGSCAAGCDRVFDADYPLPSIDEQMAAIRDNGHLPNVGPTDEDGPYNLSAMSTGMLNELEKAHLYIGQLHGKIAEQDARMARMEAALEALSAGK